MNRSTARAARAFTLLELLLAVSIGALVILQAAGVIWAANRAQNHATSVAERQAHISAALQMLADDLRQVQPQRTGNPPSLAYQTNVGPQGAAVLRLRLRPPSIAAGRPRIVDYLFVADGTAPYSWGRRIEVASQQSEAGGDQALATSAARWDVLLNEVESVQLRLFDGATWSDRWDSAARGLPRLVQITIELSDGDSRHSTSATYDLLPAARAEVSQ
jgi:prepilin-type N-terminal cleavage/methylation domain-containing protein